MWVDHKHFQTNFCSFLLGFSIYSMFSLVSPNDLTDALGVFGLLQKSYKKKERVIIKLLKFKIAFFFAR